LQDYRTRYKLRIESRGHASPQRGAPRLSPINSKCSTCDRIKVYHLGRVFSNLGDSRGRRNGVDHRLRGLESHRALVNKLHFFRPSGRRLKPASAVGLSVSRENPGQKAQRNGAKGLVAFGGCLADFFRRPRSLHSCRITRQGLPTAITFAGKSRVTTLPAPTTVFAPIVTPGQTTALPPSQTPSPITTGRAYSIPERLALASIGCVAV
jgi:hypothetical protein